MLLINSIPTLFFAPSESDLKPIHGSFSEKCDNKTFLWERQGL